MARITLVILALMLFSACLTQRKREDVTYRYLRENPTVLAKLAADKFPVKEQTKAGRPDTVTRVDTVKVRVPIVTGVDTIWMDCPAHEAIYKYIRQTDTIYQESTALAQQLLSQISDLEKQVAVQTDRNNTVTRQSENRLWWLIGTSVSLLLSLAAIVRLVFFR